VARFKLLLVTAEYHPYNLADEKTYIVEPIQFEVLSSLLDRSLFEVRLLDQRVDRSPKVLERVLQEFQPNAVGFTSWTMHVASVRRRAALVRRTTPDAIVMVGGHHAGIAPWEFADANIDYVLMGEAYHSFATLMERLREGSRDASDLTGMAWRDADGFLSNGATVIKRDFDLNRLPFPDRSLLGGYRDQYYHLWWKPIASLRTGMGCPSRCSFCNLWRPNLGKYLTWHPDYVVDYLKRIDEPYVLFVDDHFFGDVRRAFEIGERILKAGIRKQYCLYSRSDAVAKHPDLVDLWARVGLKRVRMGLESYSNEELDGLTKCNSVENNDKAIEVLKKNGIFTEGLFMVGLHYTAKEFSELGAYIRSRKIEVPNITVCTPMPGTPEFEEVNGNLRFRDPEYFDFQHAVLPTKLSLKEFCHHYGQLLLRVQRPPLEQIKLIGISTFLKRMPAFWRYFLSVYNSHKHYTQAPHPEVLPPLLPWQDRDSNIGTSVPKGPVAASSQMVTLQ
jgi:hopanoid C-3 methylase